MHLPIEGLAAVLGVILPLINELLQRLSRDGDSLSSDDSPDKVPSGAQLSFKSKKDKLQRYFGQVYADVILEVRHPTAKHKFESLCRTAKSELAIADDDESLATAEFSINRLAMELKRHKHECKSRASARFNGVLISLVFLSFATAFLYFAPQMNIDGKASIYLIDVPGYVVFWAFIGSYTAILYRFSYQGEWELGNPARWLYTRPVTGLVLGTLTYLMLQVGVVAFTNSASAAQPAGTSGTPGAALPTASTALFSLVAFLAGFSDRFADTLLVALIGKLGGSSTGGLMNGETSAAPEATGTSNDYQPVQDPLPQPGRTDHAARRRAYRIPHRAPANRYSRRTISDVLRGASRNGVQTHRHDEAEAPAASEP